MIQLKRTSCLTAIACFIALTASAQDWPNQSSLWVYDMQCVGMWGQYELSVGTDTLVEGYSGKNILLNRVSTWETGPGGETYTSQTGFERFNTVFETGDSLLYLDEPYGGDATVRLLYDFGANNGDSWLLKVDDSTPCLDSTFVNVVSSGTIDVSGESRRYIDIETTVNSAVVLEGRAIERLGLIDSQGFGFFPGYQSVDTCLIYDGDETTFTCYYDDQIGSFPNSGTPCSFLSVAENLERTISISPNPASDIIQINLDNPFEVDRIRILDLTGKRIVDMDFQKSLELSELSNGTYLLQLLFNDGSNQAVKLNIDK